MQLRADRLQQAAGFLLRQIEIAVTGHAEGRRGNNVIPVIHADRVMRDQICQENEVGGAFRGQPYQPGKSARDRDYARVS